MVVNALLKLNLHSGALRVHFQLPVTQCVTECDAERQRNHFQDGVRILHTLTTIQSI